MNRRNFLLLAGIAPIYAKEYIIKDEDVYLNQEDMITLISLDKRLRRVRGFVGFGHFNYISYEESLYYARNYSRIGSFTKDEKNL
jgi:hypothetical protein